MKKHILSLLPLAILTLPLCFTACEDVPAPYEVNINGNSSEDSTAIDVFIDESFSTSLGDFSAINTVGSYSWAVSYSSAQVTAYVDSDGDGTKENHEAESWLVSPSVDLTNVEAAHISFDYILRYGNSSELKDFYQLLISKDCEGNPAQATWTALEYNQIQGTDWETWTNSGNINVPSEFLGQSKVTVALRYKAETKAATWEVKNFKMERGAGDYSPETPSTTETKTLPYAEAFTSSLGSFKNYTTSGSGEWVIDYSTAKATGYDYSSKTTTAGTFYLVSPEISLAGETEAHVSYEYILRYNKGDENQQVYITASFDESNPANGWTLLNGTHTEGTDWSTFSEADVAIPADYLGKTIRLAFRYNTNATSGSTWEVKNFSIAAGKPNESGSSDTGGTTGDETATNGDFENWTDGKPNNWATASTAGNATLSQSTEAHGGSYSVQITGSSSANKRIGYKETTLPAGTYTMKFYAKAATSDGGSVRPGYVAVVDNAVSGSYMYGSYVDDLTTDSWTEVTHTFTLEAETQLCLVIMNAKNPGANVLIDDFTLTDANGTVYIK